MIYNIGFYVDGACFSLIKYNINNMYQRCVTLQYTQQIKN